MQNQQIDHLYPRVPYDPNMVVDSQPWLIQDLWQQGKINAMAGYEKSGKSRLLAWLLVGLHSSSCLGLSCSVQKPRTLYLAGEETIHVVNQRLKEYAVLQNLTGPLQVEFIEAAGMRLDLRQYREWLEGILVNEKFDLLVIDPLRRVHEAKENDSDEMGLINTALRRWSNRHGKSVILLHHTPKINDETDMERISNWFRGSTDMGAIVDTAQYVNRVAPTKILLKRAGRFPPLEAIKIMDLGDVRGFQRVV